MALRGSITRKYTTAFTLTETLSRVMTSCGGTSKTRVRRSTRTICWIGGTTKIRPGPFTLSKRPRKNTTPRSYSRRILIDEMASSRSSKTMPPTKYISVPLGFDVQDQPVHAGDAQRLTAAYRALGAHLPLLTAYARPALMLEIAERLGARAEHLLAAGDHRLAAALQQHADDEDQEPGARRRHAGDQRDRNLEVGQRRVFDQHDGAQHERREPADAERAVGGHEGLRRHEGDADQDERQTGVIDRQQMQRVEREQYGDRADHAGKHQSRIHEFKQQRVRAEENQQIGNARVRDDAEKAGAPVGLALLERATRELQRALDAARLDRLPLQCAQERRHVGRDDLDHLDLQRLLRRQADRFAHRLFCPVGIAS